jgi:lysophospholipase L1-like esterase
MEQEINNFKSVLDAYNAARDQLSKITKEQVVGLFKPFFDANPKIDAVKWSQYTPYFMDGDPCVFGVNEIVLVSKELFTDEDADSYHGENSVPEWDADAEFRPLFDAANEIRNPLPNELLQDIFGDHVEVTIYRDGTFDTNECSHD